MSRKYSSDEQRNDGNGKRMEMRMMLVLLATAKTLGFLYSLARALVTFVLQRLFLRILFK